MNRIEKAFESGKAFIPFITGGDPDIKTTEKLVLAMADSGADIIEIGIPFSDPIAEGNVIREADERALAGGCTIDGLFDMVKRLRGKTDIPLLFMTYINPVFVYGKKRFAGMCADCGIDGVIVPDLPFEERAEIAGECADSGVLLISMIAPTSMERIGEIARSAEGFLYCVSSLGVTGVRSDIGTGAADMIGEVRKVSNVPCAVGFGISSPAQAREMAAISDGVIVGSAIVKIVAEHGRDSLGQVSRFVREMKNAVGQAGSRNG